MAQLDETTWAYWSQYSYTDGKWTFESRYMNEIKAADCEYFAVVYDSTFGEADIKGDVSKAAVWDWSMGDSLITIASASGMYFRVSGIGDTVFDAWENAMKTYNIPYEASNWSSGKGVNSMFGMEYDPDTWAYWTTFAVVDSEWSWSELLIGNMKASENPQVMLAYGNFYDGTVPDVPLYA